MMHYLNIDSNILKNYSLFGMLKLTEESSFSSLMRVALCLEPNVASGAYKDDSLDIIFKSLCQQK